VRNRGTPEIRFSLSQGQSSGSQPFLPIFVLLLHSLRFPAQCRNLPSDSYNRLPAYTHYNLSIALSGDNCASRARFLQLPRNNMPAAVPSCVLEISRQLDDSIRSCNGSGICYAHSPCDKHDTRQIVNHVEVVIVNVLFVQGQELREGRRWIATKILLILSLRQAT